MDRHTGGRGRPGPREHLLVLGYRAGQPLSVAGQPGMRIEAGPEVGEGVLDVPAGDPEDLANGRGLGAEPGGADQPGKQLREVPGVVVRSRRRQLGVHVPQRVERVPQGRRCAGQLREYCALRVAEYGGPPELGDRHVVGRGVHSGGVAVGEYPVIRGGQGLGSGCHRRGIDEQVHHVAGQLQRLPAARFVESPRAGHHLQRPVGSRDPDHVSGATEPDRRPMEVPGQYGGDVGALAVEHRDPAGEQWRDLMGEPHRHGRSLDEVRQRTRPQRVRVVGPGAEPAADTVQPLVRHVPGLVGGENVEDTRSPGVSHRNPFGDLASYRRTTLGAHRGAGQRRRDGLDHGESQGWHRARSP